MMSATEHFDILILGSGQGGKQLAWRLARMIRRSRPGHALLWLNYHTS
jgi:hypothetical protein